MTREEKIMKRVNSHYEHLCKHGVDVLAVGLYGSQNYEMDLPTSDIDTKAILLPTKKQIITGAIAPSKEYHPVPGEEDQIDVKDLRQ
jgi:predicted nucleotidyltransferase